MKNKITKWVGLACAVACSAAVFAGCKPDAPKDNGLNQAECIESFNYAVENLKYGKNGVWDNLKITYNYEEFPDYDGLTELQIYNNGSNRFALSKPSTMSEYFFDVAGLAGLSTFNRYTLNSSLTSVDSNSSVAQTYSTMITNNIISIAYGTFSIASCDSVRDLGNNVFEISYSKTETESDGVNYGTTVIEYVAKVQRGTTNEESKLLEVDVEYTADGVIDGQPISMYGTGNVVYNYGTVDANEMARLYQLAQAYQG